MNRQEIQEWVNRLRSKETPELVQALTDEGRLQYSETAIAAIRQILAGRQVQRPSPEAALLGLRKEERWSESRSLLLESNALACISGTKCEIAFPKEGFLIPEQHEFRDWDDVVSYVLHILGLPEEQEVIFSMKRRGKYQRLNSQGRPIFTFGDPILDLVTDGHGWIIVSGDRYNLLTMRRAVAMERRGGIRSVDLAPYLQQIQRAQIEEAMARGEAFALTESTDAIVRIASCNPSTVWFHSDGASMRFRAWNKDYKVYWSMGAEIETWGGNFGYARIESDYGERQAGNFCAILKHDWDSDSNDDYVDEWEWGVNSPKPDGVRSWCTANWKGGYYTDSVQAGGCDYFIA